MHHIDITKRMEEKLDRNYTKLLRIVLNKSWKQCPTKQQMYSHLPPISQTILVGRRRHAEHSWRRKDELISDVLQWASTHRPASIGWPARTYNNSDTGCSLEDLLVWLVPFVYRLPCYSWLSIFKRVSNLIDLILYVFCPFLWVYVR